MDSLLLTPSVMNHSLRAENQPVRQLMVLPDDAFEPGAVSWSLCKEVTALVEMRSGLVVLLGFKRKHTNITGFIELVTRVIDSESMIESKEPLQARISDTAGLPIRLMEFGTRSEIEHECRRNLRLAAIDAAMQLGDATEIADLKAYAQAWEIQLEQFAARVCQKFFDGLDQGAIALMDGLNASFLPLYNYLNPIQEIVTRNRRQAIYSFPLLAEWMPMSDSVHAQTARKHVDQGIPLIKALASSWGVGEETVRWLRRQKPENIVCWQDRLGFLAQMLAPIPPEKRPSSPESWKGFWSTVEMLPKLIHRPVNTQVGNFWLRYASYSGFDSSAVSEGLVSAEALRNVSQLREDLTFVLANTALNAGVREHKLGLFPDQIADNEIYKRPPNQVIAIAKRWDRARRKMGVNVHIQEETADPRLWEPVLEAPFATADVQIVELTTPRQLLEEGNKMDNCVGSYSQTCLDGHTHILSLRTTGGKRLSTCELHVMDARGKAEIRVIQHTGFGNSASPADANMALGKLLRVLNSPEESALILNMLRTRRIRKRLKKAVGQGRQLAQLAHVMQESLARDFDFNHLVMQVRQHCMD